MSFWKCQFQDSWPHGSDSISAHVPKLSWYTSLCLTCILSYMYRTICFKFAPWGSKSRGIRTWIQLLLHLVIFLSYLRLKSNTAYWTLAHDILEEEQDIKKLYASSNSAPSRTHGPDLKHNHSPIDPFPKRHRLVHNGGFPKFETLYCSLSMVNSIEFSWNLSYEAQSSKLRSFEPIQNL